MDAAARAEDQEMLQLFFPEAALNWSPGEQMGSPAARQAAQAPRPMAGCDSSSDASRAAGPGPAAAAAGQPVLAPVPANGSGPASMELDQQQQMQMQQQLQQLLQQQLYQQQQKHLQEQQREQQELQDLQRKQQQLKEQLKQEQQQQHKWDAAVGDTDGSASAASAALGGASMYGSMPERQAASSFTLGRASSGSGSGAAQQQQQQAQQQHDDEPEPDLSRLSVMQRYHARRKLSMQRMERQVQEKMAQLGLLEQENRRLKWRAHILENMLLDIDKQLEVMSASDAAPDATQWLTLLGMGGGGSGGPQRRVARTVHRMLEGASSVDVSSWSVADCRKRWLAFLEALKPLVEEAEAAQAAHRAAQPQPQQEQTSSAGSRRPRRAAAAAAAAVIQQEAADVLGVAPLRSTSGGTIPEPPPPPPPSSSGSALDQQQDPQQLQQSHSGCSSGSDGGLLPPAHAASVEGVPGPLVARIDELVLTNFYWLLAMMSTQPVLTYEFISTDLLEGVQPLPPQESSLWSDAITRVRPSLEQLQECSSCIQVSRRCMAQVLEERAEIQASMANGLESEMHSRSNLGDSMLQLNSRDAAVERMRSNVRKESVVRNMVGFYCINVFSLFQLAQVSLACSPWFCMAWRVVGAVEERLAAQLAEPAPGGNPRPGSSTHNTRSSARLAAQR